jgi:hypothetical protein
MFYTPVSSFNQVDKGKRQNKKTEPPIEINPAIQALNLVGVKRKALTGMARTVH